MQRIFTRAALAAAITLSHGALATAAEDEAAALRAELDATRSAFQARIDALETRLRQLESAGTAPPRGSGTAGAPVQTERLDRIESRLERVEGVAAAPAAPAPSAFNPQMSVILAGSWSNLSEDPEDYVLSGFIPGGEESGPGARGFSLGESEMTLSANVDPRFYGQATFAVSPDNEVGTEEAFFRTTALPRGLTAQAGRFYSALGYVNGQHAHAWDFIDLPLAYQAMLGGQYATDGAQLKWLAPLDTFLELGVELGNGHAFPGADHGNGVGAWTLFASTGNDIGISASWKGGVSYLRSDAEERGYEEPDATLADVANPTAFSGDSAVWNAYAVYKWAPDGNSRQRNLKLQAEYFDRTEDGALNQQNATLGTGVADYRSEQSGWYVQGIYQFIPNWRVGLRYDRLDAGSTHLAMREGLLSAADFPTLEDYGPERSTLMLDWSPSEFSRLRLQYARDQSAPGAADDQVWLQYLMSLGAHGAHQF
jgi:hypothetical protein